MQEIWKDIPGYEGLYQVSNLGRVKSLGRYVKKRYGLMWKKGKVLSAAKDNKGYLVVVLCDNTKRQTFKVHRLVAMVFLENRNNKPQINHIDGNKQNNSVFNLEWCTQPENMTHAWNTGLQKRTHKKNDLKSIKVVQYSLEMQALNEYPSIMEAERQTGIYNASISACCKGKRKRAGGYIWKYA